MSKRKATPDTLTGLQGIKKKDPLTGIETEQTAPATPGEGRDRKRGQLSRELDRRVKEALQDGANLSATFRTGITISEHEKILLEILEEHLKTKGVVPGRARSAIIRAGIWTLFYNHDSETE